MNGCFRWLVVMLAAIISSSVLCSAQDREPVTPDDDEAAAHLVGPMPVIRMDFTRFPDLQIVGAIPLELVVDEQGNVTFAKLDSEDDADDDNELNESQREMLKAVLAEVEKTRTKLHFQPFEDQGHPTPARFEVFIPVRALGERPPKHVPFPQIHNWNSLRIVLSRTGCFGPCPSYSVEVHGNGNVLYEGGSHVAITGSHCASVSREVLSEMVEAFRAAEYFSLKNEYMLGATDLPTYKTSISFDGKKKEVIDYAGERVGMPASVTKLEDAIDRLSGVERWTKGNSETVPALMKEKFDFTSPRASEFLASVAQMGNADAVRDLIAAGVTVSTEPVQPRMGIFGTALENAAQRGDIDMLRTLLSTGIKDPNAKTEALERAASAGKMDAIRLLIGSGADPTAPEVVVRASSSGIPAVVQEILKYKPNVNSRDKDGTTALLASVDTNRYRENKDVDVKEVVQTLIDAGADPNLADAKGMTPLIANWRDLDVAQMLISHGANVNARADDGFTPLLNAGTIELTRLLLEHGADPFNKNAQGETALDLAKQRNRKDQAQLLESAMSGRKQ